ncbi:MAG: Uma2 family endonuclease [Chloroflexi bacterium]|nr:Uma2 family endonuclease [Chloroflexota bacterium]
MEAVALIASDKPETQKLVTAEEAAQLSTVNRRFELVKGICIDMSPAGGVHGVVANTIGSILRDHARKRQLGVVTAAETGFILARDPDTVRGADAAFISKERIPAEGVPVSFWPLAPDLAVEVVSPGDSPDEVQEKVEEYLAAGTRMVWVVYPKRQSVAVYRSLRDVKILRGDEALSGEDVLAGFECKVSEVFE